MAFTLEPRFVATPAPSYDVFGHGGGVLLVPGFYGTELSALGPGYWSETGETFVPAPIDGTAVKLSATPEVRRMHRGLVTSKGFSFCDVYGYRFAKMWVGPVVRFEPSGYAPPPESLHVADLLIDAKGTWWLAGYANGDEAKGRIYSSPDGKQWTLAVQGKHWTLSRLFAHGDRLIGLSFKQFSEVTPEGLVKLGSAKAHLDDAVFTGSGAIVAVGEGLISVLAAGAKKTKYAPCPVTRPVSLLATSTGVLLGGTEGLFHAADGIEWTQVSPMPVMALVDSKSGPLVVSHKAEVFALRQ